MRAAIALGLIAAFGCSKKPQPAKADTPPPARPATKATQEAGDKSLEELMEDDAAESRRLAEALKNFRESAPDKKEAHRAAVLASLSRLRQLWDKEADAARRLSPAVKPETIKLVEDKLENLRRRADEMEAEVRR